MHIIDGLRHVIIDHAPVLTVSAVPTTLFGDASGGWGVQLNVKQHTTGEQSGCPRYIRGNDKVNHIQRSDDYW